MKAVVMKKFGAPEVLSLQEVKAPVPGEKEVCIKVFATTVSAADCMMRKCGTLLGRILLGFWRPRKQFQILGLELAGEVHDIGPGCTRFQKGDRVFGFASFSVGAYAQYNCLPESRSLALIPDALTYEEAAAVVDGPTTALHFLREQAKIQRGEKVLIIGASGSIGTSAVQMARYFGADVTGVCSGGNARLVTSLGAHRVIDYTAEDFTKNGEQYDIIFDTVGKSSFSRCKPSLTKYGRYLLTVGGLRHALWGIWTKLFCQKRLISTMSIEKNEALIFVRQMIKAGDLKPVIDRRYGLEEIVEAHRYVDKGHKKGNVVICVAHETQAQVNAR